MKFNLEQFYNFCRQLKIEGCKLRQNNLVSIVWLILFMESRAATGMTA